MQGIALLIILGGLCSAVSSIRIGAFNIQKFGQAKLDKTIKDGSKTIPVTEVLFKILKRYDVVLIQEIVMDDDTFRSFFEDFNKLVTGDANLDYSYVISEYLGTGSDNRGKEKYAYIYNTKTISLKSSVFPDNLNNVNFARSPFIAYVQDLTPYNAAALKPFYLVGLHAKPCKCIQEMNKLEAVYKWLHNSPNYDRVIFLGDFNAGCSYFKEGVDEHEVPFLYSNANMRHLITEPTNIAKKKCPYDKMVASKCIFLRDTLSNANIFDFPSQLPFTSGALSMKQARKVSDHLPIEVELIATDNGPPDGCVTP